MRILTLAAAGLLAASATAAGAAERLPVQKIAISVERAAVPASYRGPTVGQGYDARTRRIATCLASYENYDPRIDRIVVAPGVTRRCAP